MPNTVNVVFNYSSRESTGRKVKLRSHVIARRESRVWRSALISFISASLVMVFKPFKPPLIRKPETTESSQEKDTSSKAPQQEDSAPGTETRSTPSGVRKPLHQVRNVGKESGGQVTPAPEAIKLVGDEKFFNALWYVALNLICPFISISGPV